MRLVSALGAADAAVLLVAAQAGVEVGTGTAWAMCEARGLPRIIFVNKMDRENADFLRSLESIRSRVWSQVRTNPSACRR